MRNNREKLLDILEAIERIEKYSIQGRQAFEEDELIQNWLIRHLQIIGEASRALSNEIREQNSEISWSKIIGMRNILTHNYFEIDLDIVWSVVENELPNLKAKIEEVLKLLS